jgi:hypothetical protein
MAQALKTAAKPATKPATKRAAKPATPAPALETQAAQDAPVQTLTYAIRDGYRPAAGRMLFAMTQAWLDASGLSEGKAIPRAVAVKVAGGTAIAYHTAKTAALQDVAGMVSLTESGKAFFAARKPDAKMVAAYRGVMHTGAPDEAVGVKTPAAIVKIG